ncbi:TetR/AcrR family transcriptional regulator [Pedobacter xixiisoli]|uniref:Transcriptional regulator, TetR family n=1 Tax=Pedobacter xixiisoli TaxID=1476464 RepID=A0A286A808_9SPHI|nr:TetR/AcrR family transcriptional regulator [Pedobacter xixiisoli]SOD18048.1 transcriptional regulator, TetR family [Pedobacter xixiisoli]
MLVKNDRQKQKELTKNSILQVAEEIVLQEGWQAVSMRKIAEAIGYSLPVVYNHFESKDAIQEEFVKNGFNMLALDMQSTKEKFQEPEQQLIQMALSYYDFAFRNSAYYKMMFGLGIPSCQKAREIKEICNFSSILINTISSLMEDADEQRKFLKFHTLWSILHGLTSINMVNLTAAPDEMQQQILLDAIQGFIKNINR